MSQFGPYYGQDKVKWLVLALSPFSSRVYTMWGALEWQTEKGDDGNAGTFEVTIPYINPYTASGQPQPLVAEYAAVMSPMDIIAIYAFRTRSDNLANIVPIGPLGSTTDGPNTALTYGDITSMTTMGSATCVMIGMADNPVEAPFIMSDQPSAHISISGKDLTKVFYVNDANVPAQSVAASSGIYDAPLTQVITGSASGTLLLERFLDLVVAKNVGGVPGVKSPAVASFAEFGYPWRNFVRTDALDPSFTHLESGSYPSFNVQNGSGWANVQELRNPPAFRLFVNEIGQLIFDSSVDAWTTQAATGNLSAADIHECIISMPDDDLITYLTVVPYAAMAGQFAIATMKGYAAGLGFAGDISGLPAGAPPSYPLAAPSQAPQSAVGIYGYRYAEFNAIFAISPADVAAQRKALTLFHNSLYRGHLVIRGTTAWRVGQRILVPVQTAKGATTNQIWYIERISHHATFGDDWRTTLALRFPGGA